MYSKLLSLSRGFYLAGIVLLLVLVIPTPWFPFQLAKLALFAVFLFVSVVLFALSGGMRELLRSHGFKLALLTALLPLIYLLSYYFSIDTSVGLTGFGIESDTVVFTTLLFLTFITSFALFRTLRTVKLLQTVVFWALVAATIFQCVSIIFGSAAIPLATFADRSVNLVGKWNDLGLLVGLLAMLLLSRVELGSVSHVRKLVIGIALAVLAVLLGIVNFSLVWSLVLAFCVVLAIIKFVQRRTDAQESGSTWVEKTPWYAFAGIVISLLFIFFGSGVNLNLTNFFPVSSLEVRPSYSATLGIINASREGSFSRILVGSGPNTFGEEWSMKKPAEVNQSQFWNIDFNVGFSSFVTALGTVGLLGVIAWLLPLLLVMAALVRVVRGGVLNREDTIVATTMGVGSLFLLASIILYVPSQNILLLALALSGAIFGFLWRQGQSRSEDEYTSGFMRLVTITAMIVLVLLSGVVALSTGRRLVAQAHVGHGSQLLSEGDVEGAIAEANTSTKLDKTSDSLRLSISAYTAKLQKLAASTSTAAAELQKQFADTGQAALNAGQDAEKLNPKDYRPTFLLAQMYEYLATLGVNGAAERAAETYKTAMVKNPTHPAIVLGLARLYAAQNNKDLTATYLTQTLKLKPNYTDAILLVVQLDVANNDVEGAIQAATAAAQTAPGVAPIWFELGLLYYSKGDATHAAQALEQAISIVPNYANAKYFLGLSYYNLGRIPEAVKQFQDLLATNAGSPELTLILNNLLAGRKPFDGAQPPVTPTPQTRPNAPVNE